MRCVLIANPAAGRGHVGRNWDALVAQVCEALGDVDARRTQRPGHAVDLAREAAEEGADTVLSLGGDGTHHEVVNGLMAASVPGRRVAFGALPAGTGGDFCRLYGVERTVRDVARHLADGQTRQLDVGHVTFVDDDGREAERWFLNICSTGIGGLVDRYVASARARVGGKAAYYLASLRASVAYRAARCEVVIDGASVGEHVVNTVAACNGRWFGGGMMIAPEARTDDGLLDVVLIPETTPRRVIELSRRIYDGRHMELPYVKHWRGQSVEVHVREHTAWMDIDGEAPGKGACTMRLEPAALTLLGATR